MSWIAITGGSGYIGSHIMASLQENTKYSIFNIDFRTNELTHTIPLCDTFVTNPILDPVTINALIAYKPEILIHCASTPPVGNNIHNTINYWNNDVFNSVKLIEACVTSSIKKLVYISSTDLYAFTDIEVNEHSEIEHRSAYLNSIFTIENLLIDAGRSYGIDVVILRAPVIAGSHSTLNIGDLSKSPNTFSSMIESFVYDIPFDVNGRTWDTLDGTIVKNYLHINDLTSAVLNAINYIKSNIGYNHIFNVSTTESISLESLILHTEKILDKELMYRYIGADEIVDIDSILIDSSKANTMLNWSPKFSIDDMIRDSYKWYTSETFKSLKNLNIFKEYNKFR